MPNELEDLREHLERYRAVTLQHFDILSEQELSWRPRPDAFSSGQHLLHILHNEDFYIRGLAANDWDLERLRFPQPFPSKGVLRWMFDDVRRATRIYLDSLSLAALSEVRRPGHAPIDATVRTWLWFILEHEIHHKAQLAEYLRAMGHVPPYFGIALPLGTRPDIAAREALGGI
jgi:uncharacterized damage-inducible protein DinB